MYTLCKGHEIGSACVLGYRTKGFIKQTLDSWWLADILSNASVIFGYSFVDC